MQIERKFKDTDKLVIALGITEDRLNVILDNMKDVILGDESDVLSKMTGMLRVCVNDNERAFALMHFGAHVSKSQMYLAICNNYHPQEAEQLIDYIIEQSPDIGAKNTAKVWSKKYYNEVILISKKTNSYEGVFLPKDGEEYFGEFKFSDLDNLKEQLVKKGIDPASIIAEAGLSGAIKIKFH